MAGSKISRELALLLTGKDISASKAVRGVDRSLKNLNKTGRNAASAVGRNIERAAIVGATAATAAIGYAVNQAMTFEAQLNTINTIAREDASGLAGIGDAIRAESRATGTAVEDLSAAYYDLLSAGVEKGAAATKVMHDANTLAIGGISTTAEAVDLLTTAINTYGGDASKSAQFADEFAVAVERGKVTASELAASYATVGPLAASLGIENQELAAGYARLTAGGTGAGEAATQMASAMTALIKKSAGLKKLEKQTKRNYAAIADKDGLAAAYEQLRKDAKDADVELVDLLGRKEALLYALQVTGPNQEAYNEDLAAMGDAAGTAAEQMGERQKGLAAELKRLKANVDSAAITIGNKLIPILADLASEGTAWLEANQDEIGDFAEDLANGLRDAVTWAKSLDWAAIGSALQLGAQATGTIVAAFNSMPDWVKTAVLTGWGLNKLTGGAVVDLGKIVFDQFAGRGASPANPVWVAQIGGKGAPGSGGGGGGSGAGGNKGGGGKGPNRTPSRVDAKGMFRNGALLVAVAAGIKGDTPQGAMAPSDYEAMLRRMLDQGRGDEAINSLGTTVSQELQRLGVTLTAGGPDKRGGHPSQLGKPPKNAMDGHPSQLGKDGSGYAAHQTRLAERILAGTQDTSTKVGRLEIVQRRLAATGDVKAAAAIGRMREAILDGTPSQKALKDEMERVSAMVDAAKDDQVRELNTAKRETTRGLSLTTSATRATEMAARGAGVSTASAMRQAAATIVAGIARYQAIVNISATTVQRTYNVGSRAGNPLASRHE